jgi:hypothetical protein
MPYSCNILFSVFTCLIAGVIENQMIILLF